MSKPPWIFDDPFALVLIGPGWADMAARSMAGAPERLVSQGRAMVAARSRYAEDRLPPSGFTQYVILGAGLDSFAWRRPDLVGPMRVFEVDHPSAQAWKRQRIKELGLPTSEHHVFVPVDFETGTLADALDLAGFDWSRGTLWSWVGTTMYLSRDAVESTLGTLGKCGPRSEVAMSYNLASDFLDDDGRAFLESLARRGGERGLLRSSFAPDEMEALIGRCGLTVVDHPTADDLYDRYFAGREDGLRPFSLERLITARV
jgi:methyltransferase (TIGR00027 family)